MSENPFIKADLHTAARYSLTYGNYCLSGQAQYLTQSSHLPNLYQLSTYSTLHSVRTGGNIKEEMVESKDKDGLAPLPSLHVKTVQSGSSPLRDSFWVNPRRKHFFKRPE